MKKKQRRSKLRKTSMTMIQMQKWTVKRTMKKVRKKAQEKSIGKKNAMSVRRQMINECVVKLALTLVMFNVQDSLSLQKTTGTAKIA